MAQVAHIDSLHFVSTETVINLLQNINFCDAAHSSVNVELNFDEWKMRFKLLSVEERCKFDEETLINMNNIWTSNSSNKGSTNCCVDNIVVTILLAVKGIHKLPKINETMYLKEALQKIASIPVQHTLAVEVFWTAQNENNMKWERKLVEDFPFLRAL